MNGLRKLADGTWNKPPVLTGARALFAQGLARRYPLVALGEMATFVNGTSYDVGLVGSGNVPIIRISNMTDPESGYLRTGQDFDRKFHVARGDLLVSWSASFRSILWPGPVGILNQHIFKVTEHPENDRSYIRHAIEAAFDEMQRSVVGIGMMHLRRADFLGHLIPCPPADVQAAVGAYLDWIESGCREPEPEVPEELATERGTVERINTTAARLDEISLLRTEASREGRALLSACLNNLSIGFGTLGRLADVLTGKPRNGWSARCDNAPNGTPVLALSAVTGFRYDSSAIKRTSLAVDEDAHYWLAPNDLLITRSNTPELVGHAAIYDGIPARCIYPDLMMRVPLDRDKVDTRFAWYWLQAPLVREFIMGEAKGTSPTMKKISQGTVMQIPFPVEFSLGEQRRTAARLDEFLKLIDDIASHQASVAPEVDAMVPAVLESALLGKPSLSEELEPA